MSPPNPKSPAADPTTPSMIRLDDLLKRRGLVGTGGEAKIRIQAGEVIVNGQCETRRRRQLHVHDVIQFQGQTIEVEWSDLVDRVSPPHCDPGT